MLSRKIETNYADIKHKIDKKRGLIDKTNVF